MCTFYFFFSSRRRHTRWPRDWSSDVCSSDLASTVQIEFDFDTDMDEAENEVQKALSDISLPEEATDPEVSRLSLRSEERRVGKEWRIRGRTCNEKTMRVEEQRVRARYNIDQM